jgi:ATP-dependent helicase/nuclease subunit A
MLDDVKERKDGYVQLAGEAQAADCVRIMTIHGSKGLEFPVVYIAGLERIFNVRDLSGDFLTHGEHGLSVAYVDEERRLKI